jgi:thymidylate synthase (FAD)
LSEEFFVPEPDQVGAQSTDNKQGRTMASADDLVKRQNEVGRVREQCQRAFALYHELLASDWPRELARIVLPLATYSHMFTTSNLLNLFKLITLRSDPHAQAETRQYALAMLELIRPVAPVSVAAWESQRAESPS